VKLHVLGTGSADGWPNPMCRCESCNDARARGISRHHTSVLVDDVILFDIGPDVPRAAERFGVTLANVEHIVVGHGHPDHLDPAAFLWRSWVTDPTPLTVHAPQAALDVISPWLAPGDPRNPTLSARKDDDRVELHTSKGRYVLSALAADHVGAKHRSTGPVDVHCDSALVYLLEGPDRTRVLYATDTGLLPPSTLDALRDTAVEVVFLDETFGPFVDHGTGHHDFESFAEQLRELREVNAVTPTTDVIAVHLSHHNPVDLNPVLRALGARSVPDGRVVFTSNLSPAR